MKLLKRTIIWFVLLTGIFFVVNAVGSLIVDKVIVNRMTDAMTGYTVKVNRMIHPEPKEPDETNKTNGLSGLFLREMLDNTCLDLKSGFTSTFYFMNMQMDQSVIMFNDSGLSRLSEGIYAVAFEDNDQGLDHFKSSVGVVDIKELVKLDGSGEILKILGTGDDILLRLDSYTVDEDFVVSPARITLLHEGGREIAAFDFPVSGEVINSDKTYIYHDNSDKVHSQSSLYLKMKVAKEGERKSDRFAKELVSKAEFTGEQNDLDKNYGIGVIAAKRVETSGDQAMVTVLRFRFLRCVFLDTGVLGAIMTLIMVLICRHKDKKQARADYGYSGNYGYRNNYNYNNYRR